MLEALMVLGTAFGGLLSAGGISEEHEAEARASEENAKIARKNSRLVLEKAAEDESKYRIFSEKALGSIRVAYGASGVTMEGSPTEVMTENVATQQKNVMTIRYRGEMESLGYLDEASQLINRAKNIRQAGSNRVAASLLKSLPGVAGGVLGVAQGAASLLKVDDVLENPFETFGGGVGSRTRNYLTGARRMKLERAS
jgi:hypothetical protein